MDFFIFKNKFVKYRKESFGGIVSFNSNTYILNKKEYNLLDKINQKRYILKSSLNKSEIEICNKLIYNQIFLKLNFDKAKKILESNRK